MLVWLLLPIPLELVPAHSPDDPLANVPAQVQQEIADAVGGIVRPPPYLLVAQVLQAALDLRQVV